MSAEFRPCIDLHDGKVKQIVGSTLELPDAAPVATNFVSERPPEYYAELYRKDDLTGGHVIQLGQGNQQRVFAVIQCDYRCRGSVAVIERIVAGGSGTGRGDVSGRFAGGRDVAFACDTGTGL